MDVMMNSKPEMSRVGLVAALLCVAPAHVAAQDAAAEPEGAGELSAALGEEAATDGADDAAQEQGEYGAVAVAPAPGTKLSLRKTPRSVQRIGRDALDEERAIGIHEALDARLGGVSINHVQNNPLQPDVQYRGFTASPLLGVPQGLAIYQNGVRVNEPFGDVVQWDLIPEYAIRDIQLMPGANPLYGLNALGGALVLQMKDGYRDAGHRVSVLGGSFGRHRLSVEYGRTFENWAAYAGVSSFGERGFRDHSESRALHGFADLRHRTPKFEIGLNITLADTDLNGNGPAPVGLLRLQRDAVFTYPDNTDNALVLVAVDADRQLFDDVSVQGTAYVRQLGRDTLNGDEAEFGVCFDPLLQPAVCNEGGGLVTSEAGSLIASDVAYDGLTHTTHTQSDGYGGSAQLTIERAVLERDNQLIVGTSYDGSHTTFLQRAELGLLALDRSVVGQNIFLGDAEFRTSLQTANRSLGVYASDTFNLIDAVALQGAARLNWVNIKLDDREGADLDGQHTFVRINASAGVIFTAADELAIFTSYSEGSRAPSAAELACADPEAPCRLPNAFVSDPPLDQVVNRTVEVGARGIVGDVARPTLTWSVAGFRSRNANDIIFVAGSLVGTGYFRNADATQRVGFEAALSLNSGPLRAYASYQRINATFEDDLELPGGGNPEADGGDDDDEGGTIAVESGDRMPGIPRHALKAGVTLEPIEGWKVGMSTVMQGSQPFRGDEANLVAPLGGFAVFNAHTSYDLLAQLEVFVQARNLFDTRYETFGVLADPSGVLPGTSDPRFVSLGPPLSIFAGLTLHDQE